MQPNATLAFSFTTRVTAFLLFCLAGLSASAQLVSFPGAEGAGRFTSGGRGTSAAPTTVYAVTSLADDNTAGTLRYALAQNVSSRTVVFRVSGTIRLTSPLTIKANTTIAGQTAPGGGICIADYPVTIGGDNVIVRYIRFRLGDRNQQARAGGDDAFGGTGRKNIIIDHCTMSWSNDEALTIYGGDSTTIQWNIISEPLNLSFHDEGSGVEQHGYGGIQGGRRTSIHHNLFAHCYSRTPRFDGTRNLGNSAAGLENVEFVNNVLYNWGTNNVYGGEGGNYNIINNYYKYGPSTSSSVRFRVVNPYKQASGPAIPWGKFYLSGNYVDGSTTNTNNNWRGVTMDGGSNSDTVSAKVTTAFSIAGVTTQDAASAYSLVLQQAGASLPIRDSLDQRIVNDVMNRTGRIIDAQGGYPRLTPFSTTQSAWPTLTSTTAPVDTDGDGMPDSYETANSLNPNNAADRQTIAANGYTNLENYLNGITTTPSFSVSGNLSGFSQTVGSPSAARAYNLSGSNLTSDVSITAPANFQVSSNGTTWGSTATVTVSGGNLSTSNVFVRMNASAAGSYSGTISNTTSSITQTIAVDGIAVTAPTGVNVTVAKDGTGNYTTIQAAIDASTNTAASTTPYVIYIKNGKYREKITVPSSKAFIHLIGESVANTIVYYDDPATTLGTSGSASFTVNGTDFAAINLTFANTFGDGSQAVAMLVNNDRAVFKNCRFMGNQDTYYVKGAGTPRVYLSKCYIDGNVDFIFGSAIAVFDSCVIYPKTRANTTSSFITAANTPTGQNYGLVFRNSIIANNTGGTTYFLGRPWQNTTTVTPQLLNNRTTFLNTTMGSTIDPAGWTTWDATTVTSGIDYGEYNSKDFSGAAVSTAARVPWATQLTAAQAGNYTNANLFGSWDPCAVNTQICSYQPEQIAVSNFRASKTAGSGNIDWNISWNKTGIKYDLYRSSTRNGGYSLLNSVTSANNTNYNFNYADALPAQGTVYYYYVVASMTGFASHTTDTVSISNLQTITVTPSSLNAFTQNVGTPSPSQTITISGTNLTDDITVTPPANYEVSANGAQWFTAASPLVLPQTSGAVAATPVQVRLNSASIGTWGGDVAVSSPGATPVNVPVTGTTAIIAPVTRQVLQWWPMTANNADSTNARAAGVAPSTTRFNRMTVSNGTTVAVVPPYSPQRGQALAPITSVLGEGLWSSAAGGPGGSLNRTIYEQFVVKGAGPNDSLQIDSVILNANFYNSSSNTRMGIVWSKTGFTTNDSTDVSTNPGGFTNFILLNNNTSGPIDIYRLAFNGTTGVSIKRGDSLTFRIYFSCSSSSNGRYALIKDVKVVGSRYDASIPAPSITVNPATLAPFNQVLGIPSASQSYSVSATDLTTPLLILAPANYEVSTNGTTWYNSTTPLILAPTSGAVAATTVQVRLNAAAVGTSNGVIKNQVAGGTNKDVTVTGTTTATPVIVATPATLAAFSQTLGSPSATQTYTLSAYNLTGNLTVTPPANYEISDDGGTTWYTSASPLSITPVATNVAATVITVRLNAPAAGTYTGNLANASAGATTVNIPLNGTTSGTPTLVQSGTLSNFAQTVGTPSAVQTYTLSGSALSGNVTVTPPAGYEVSSDGGATWFNSTTPLSLTPVSGTLATTTISIRLNAATAGTYAGNVLHASAGATSINVPVNGVAVPAPVFTATAALTPFSQTIGAPSAVQTYTVSGSNLVGNVTITPPAGYEISDNGTNWYTNTSALTLTPVSGSIATTTISVRLNAATAGSYNGNIIHIGTGFATVNVPVTGTAILPPTVTVAPATLTQFAQTIGAPSAAQQYTVSGQNLTGAVTITAPAGFQLSLDGTTWGTAPLSLSPSSGTLSSTSIYVRLNATTPGNYGGNITNASAGATTRNVSITGVAVPPPSITVTGTPLQPFRQVLGTPSAAQSYVLTGAGLLGNVTIAPPPGFQVSLDSGRTWSFLPVALASNNGSLNIAVWVRLNAGTTGIKGYTIPHNTPSVATVFVDVTGETVGENTGAYSVYPIPAYNVIWFAHPVTSKAATISIYNAMGQRVRVLNANANAVETQIRINLLAQGLYYAVYENGDERITRQFIKK